MVGGRLSGVCACGIGLARAGQRLFDERAVSRDELNVESLNGKNVAGFGDDVAKFSRVEKSFVGEPAILRDAVSGFAIFAVVDEGADGNTGGELRSAANVIVVVVGDEDEINFAETGVVSGGDDAIGIAIVVAGPAGVDEEGLSEGRDEQGGLAAFDVDEINLQGICGRCGWKRERE